MCLPSGALLRAADGYGAGSTPRMVAQFALLNSLFAILLLPGCAHVPNQWREDGPATTAEWESPTAKDVRAKHAPAEQRQRNWEATSAAGESGVVTHWPLYFEDPFEDKGHGRSDYRLGWEDYVAMPYGYARYTLNWLMLPVSAIVTPPWTLMESDGVLSRQALGYDHDATPARQPAPPAEEQLEEAAPAPEAAEAPVPPEEPSDNSP